MKYRVITHKCNQLLNITATKGETFTKEGITITYLGNGYFNIKGTSNNFSGVQYLSFGVAEYLNIQEGHKYLFLCNRIAGSAWAKYRIGDIWRSYAFSTDTQPNAIFTGVAGRPQFACSLTVWGNQTIPETNFRVLLVDLTAIYGAGNEPDAPIEVINDYPAYSGYVSYGGIKTKYRPLTTNINVNKINPYSGAWSGNRTSVHVYSDHVTATVSSTAYNFVQAAKDLTISQLAVGHKYYLSSEVFLPEGMNNVAVTITINNVGNTAQEVQKYNPAGNQWVRLEKIIEGPDTVRTRVDRFYYRFTYFSDAYTDKRHIKLGDTFSFRNACLIDLTELYGAGHEPTDVSKIPTYLKNNNIHNKVII